MSKRNVAYIKPQDPSFLAKLKAQLGPSNEPTIETKKQKLDNEWDSDSDSDHVKEDEKPQIVVLEKGDLTAEEVDRISKEAAEAPADLNQRVIFRKRKSESSKSTATDSTINSNSSTATNPKKSKTKHSSTKTTTPTALISSSKSTTNNKLSFNQDEEDDNLEESE